MAKVGGQAVIEGVMLKSENAMSVAVRKLDGNIAVKIKELTPLAKRAYIFRLPFARGFLQLFSLLILGFEALKFSVDVIEETDKKSNNLYFIGSAVVAILFTILFFFLLPLFLTNFLNKYLVILESHFWFNFVEGVIRVALFILYLLSISLMKDIKRVFEYHGAEHKVISAYENNEDLTIDNVKKYSRFHPRCGTSFLILVVLLSIIFFSLFRSDLWLYKILLRIIAFPVLAGVIYEFLKLEKTKYFKFIFLPGLWLQKITTREPDDTQIEVAIQAFKNLKL
ncbi:MAG: DUF1385 domain-containing protein [Proteobacteria bacterium]|nr:DUF1385 domain-containing protein [Pseudomonadota bacterium]